MLNPNPKSWHCMTIASSPTTAVADHNGRNTSHHSASPSKSITTSHHQLQHHGYLFLLYPALATAITLYLSTIVKRVIKKIPPMIYDKMILNMTEVWYRSVLNRVDEGSYLLDVGIGTAGALLRCKDLLQSRNITIHGIDYSAIYVDSARESVRRHDLQSLISIDHLSVYDLPSSSSSHSPLNATATTSPTTTNNTQQQHQYDAAYFSGSLSLLPDPVAALRTVSSIIHPGGCIYVTQTFQRHSPPFFGFIKPYLKLFCTVDFGRLVTEDDILKIYETSGLEVEEHGVLEGSVDNVYQAAYLTVLRVPL